MRKFDTVFRGYDKVQVQKCLDEIKKTTNVALRVPVNACLKLYS